MTDTKPCAQCGEPFGRKRYASRRGRQALSAFRRQRFCSTACRVTHLNHGRVAAPVAQPWRDGDDQRLQNMIWKYRGAIRRCGLEEEDVAQLARLSLLRRPIPDHLSAATRAWNIRNRVLDVMRQHAVISRSGRTDTRQTFHLATVSLDAQRPDGSPCYGEPSVPPAPDPEPWLRRLVDALPPRRRQVILGLFWHGQSGPDLCRDMGVTHGRVSQIKAAALATLRRQLCV